MSKTLSQFLTEAYPPKDPSGEVDKYTLSVKQKNRWDEYQQFDSFEAASSFVGRLLDKQDLAWSKNGANTWTMGRYRIVKK